MTMTSEAKRALSKTIRALRARLLDDLHAATEAAYRLSVPAGEAELPEAARSIASGWKPGSPSRCGPKLPARNADGRRLPPRS